MIELVIRYFLLILIFLGLYQFSYNYLKIKEAFTPIFILSSVGIVVFVSGLLNVMQVTTVLITLLALGVLIQSLYKKTFHLEFSTGILYFFGLVLYFTIMLRGNTFIHYDDFSHWGLVAREISLTDQFPNFESTLISFQSYPTGSAAFIYFVSEILGSSEGIYLFAQSTLLIASITSFFSFFKKNKLINLVLILGATIFFLKVYVTPLVLLVDTLIPLLGLAAAAIISYYGKEENIKQAFLVTLPILSFLMVIKNSSIFFVLLNVILLSYFTFKKIGFHKNAIIISVTSFLIPYSFLYLWNQHVKYAFPSGLEAKHSVSLTNFDSIFNSKTVQDIEYINSEFFKRMTNITYTDVKIIVFLLVFLILVIIIKTALKIKLSNKLSEYKLTFIIIGIYGLYQASLWAMYLLTMPLGEALILAGYTRYSYTIIIFLYGLTLFYFVTLFQDKRYDIGRLKLVKYITLFSLIVVPIMIRTKPENIGTLFTYEFRELSVREKLNQVLEGYDVPQEETIYLYISDNPELNNGGILKYVAKYELRSTKINVIDQDELNVSILDNKGYLIVMESDDKLIELLNRYGNDVVNKKVIRLENL